MSPEYKLLRKMPSMGGVSPDCDCYECHGRRKYNKLAPTHQPPKVQNMNFSWSEVEITDGDSTSKVYPGYCPETKTVARLETNAMIFTKNPPFRVDRNEWVCDFGENCLNSSCKMYKKTGQDPAQIEAATEIGKLLQ